MRNPKSPVLLITTLLLLVAVGCNNDGTTDTNVETEAPAIAVTEPPEVPTQPQSESDPTEPALEEPTAPPATEAASATEVPAQQPEQPSIDITPCTEVVCVESGSFWLTRPIDPAGRVTIDPSYRFGDYRQSTQLTHRGVDFLNSTGTSVIAAADGIVVVAGDDLNTPYGPRKDYYGKLVILEHNFPGLDQPLFTLYSQLSDVLVEEGQSVAAGEEIALVGMTGAVPGSTLHFEVRLGENSYQTTRNPELWLQLLSDERGQQLRLRTRVAETFRVESGSL